ncbi:MAG TPA: hypothetical protein VFK62_05460 [Gaiellaceae bacterium]|nr:hypothetical protein [Gaiellaceae bacterium]
MFAENIRDRRLQDVGALEIGTDDELLAEQEPELFLRSRRTACARRSRR